MKLHITFVLSLAILACSSNKKMKETKEMMVGSDQDEHGCKPSAGYTWSILKNDCVRFFEIGIALEPTKETLKNGTIAFVITNENEKGKVEVFIPSQNGGIILLQTAENHKIWKNDTLTLERKENSYLLFSGTEEIYEGLISEK